VVIVAKIAENRDVTIKKGKPYYRLATLTGGGGNATGRGGGEGDLYRHRKTSGEKTLSISTQREGTYREGSPRALVFRGFKRRKKERNEGEEKGCGTPSPGQELLSGYRTRNGDLEKNIDAEDNSGTQQKLSLPKIEGKYYENSRT